MRKVLAGLVLAAAMVACSGEPVAPAYAAGPPPPDLSPAAPRRVVTVADEVLAVASVRSVVAGVLHQTRAVSNADEVRLEIRRVASGGGFASLTSGTLVGELSGTGQVEYLLSTSVGYRYLVVAYPRVNGVDNASRAAFVEFTT